METGRFGLGGKVLLSRKIKVGSPFDLSSRRNS